MMVTKTFGEIIISLSKKSMEASKERIMRDLGNNVYFRNELAIVIGYKDISNKMTEKVLIFTILPSVRNLNTLLLIKII